MNFEFKIQKFESSHPSINYLCKSAELRTRIVKPIEASAAEITKRNKVIKKESRSSKRKLKCKKRREIAISNNSKEIRIKILLL